MTNRALMVLVFVFSAIPLLAQATEYPEFDQAGNKYPLECRRDLSFIAARVVPIDDLPDPRMQALYVPSIGGKHDLILIRRSLAGWKRADAEQHERCHALMLTLYPETGGRWHP